MLGDDAKFTGNMNIHEAKGDPVALPATKIVSAYGLRKCPKIVEQIANPSSFEVRVNALIALCDEMQNPYSVYGCAEAGIVPVLSAMITDVDYETRLHSSKALAIMAKDANGLDAILRDDAIPNILLGCKDPSEDVRCNVFECLQQVTRTADGVDACNAAGVTASFVNAIRSEGDEIRRILLPALYNIAGSDVGLVEALASGAVEVCVKLLDSDDPCVIAASARALGFLCLDERGKKDSLDHKAVPKLIEVLNKKYPNSLNKSQSRPMKYSSASGSGLPSTVKASVLMALTSITSTDEGKRQCDSDLCVETIVDLICEDHSSNADAKNANSKQGIATASAGGDRLIQLNVLKVISNIAVSPDIRKKLLKPSNGRLLKRLNSIKEGSDTLLTRHADIAISAVTWKP